MMIFIAPELASPKTLCSIQRSGHDAYHPYLMHCALSRSDVSHERSGKLRNADMRIAAKTPCLIVAFNMPSLANNPIALTIHNPKRTCIPCAHMITAKTFLAMLSIGDPCAKKSAKKYSTHITSKSIAI